MNVVLVPGRRDTRQRRGHGRGIELIQLVAETDEDVVILHALAAVVGQKNPAGQLRVMLRAAGYPLPQTREGVNPDGQVR